MPCLLTVMVNCIFVGDTIGRVCLLDLGSYQFVQGILLTHIPSRTAGAFPLLRPCPPRAGAGRAAVQHPGASPVVSLWLYFAPPQPLMRLSPLVCVHESLVSSRMCHMTHKTPTPTFSAIFLNGLSAFKIFCRIVYIDWIWFFFVTHMCYKCHLLLCGLPLS